MITPINSNIYSAKILFYLLRFLANLMDYLYVSIKIYRILCFAKLTFEQLPLYNPYKWPLSFIRIATRPYLSFWSRFLPNLKIGHMTHEISTVIALEILSALLKISFTSRSFLLAKAEAFNTFLL